jgi:hypothetical protein
MNKSSFVRSLPSAMPASEVVKQAKARGITITAKHVHVIRSLERKRKLRAGIAKNAARDPKPGASEAYAKPTRPAVDRHSTTAEITAHNEKALRTLVMHIGLDRAQAILHEMKRGL